MLTRLFLFEGPKFEEFFGVVEAEQSHLLDKIIDSERIPSAGSSERTSLFNGIMFQAGRTASTVANMDHMFEQFGKAVLRHHFERDGEHELLEYLPEVRFATTTEALIAAIRRHLLCVFEMEYACLTPQEKIS